MGKEVEETNYGGRKRMIEYRCKCGKTRAITSMGVASCYGCEECGSNLLPLGVGGWSKPVKHIWKRKYNPNTGKAYYVCDRCFELKKKDLSRKTKTI